jgi:hypothetical protein
VIELRKKEETDGNKERNNNRRSATAVQYKINCKRCSLLSVCHKFNAVCAVIGCEAFVERGKVTVTSYYRETPKNAGEIIKNR